MMAADSTPRVISGCAHQTHAAWVSAAKQAVAGRLARVPSYLHAGVERADSVLPVDLQQHGDEPFGVVTAAGFGHDVGTLAGEGDDGRDGAAHRAKDEGLRRRQEPVRPALGSANVSTAGEQRLMGGGGGADRAAPRESTMALQTLKV